jgi:hypothetical protein
MLVRWHVCVCVCACVPVCACLYARPWECMPVCACVRVHALVNVCLCIFQ